jgi:hypothetical protein
MKMTFDAPINDKAKENFDLLYDVQIWLGFVAISPLLQSIHSLIKFSSMWDIFIYDFMATTEVCYREIYEL